MPIAEVQAKWLATLLTGDYALPPAQQIRRRTLEEYRRALEGYVRSARHTIQVRDCAIYSHGIRREIERGRQRARRGGHVLDIPARAHEIRAPESVAESPARPSARMA